MQAWADVEDLSSIEDHANALVTADSTVRRLVVLNAAEERGYGGIRLLCLAHPSTGDMSFRELRRHAIKFDHTDGDVVRAPGDARELGRASDHDERDDR